MRHRAISALAAVVVLAGLFGAPAGAAATQPAVAPPAGDISKNVSFITNVPMPSAISINFIDDVMIVSTASGLYTYDVSDPAAPTPLGSLPMYIWENEDIDVDVERKLAFISRDPRGFTSPAAGGDTFPYGAVHVIDVSNPTAMQQVGVFTVPAGHTTSCVNKCDFVWTGGPYANAETQPDFVGRPIYSTDVTDPANPVPCPEPIDTGRNDGVTDYAHDVQVDAKGVAWVSGAGGVRGYWTSGRHKNPLTGKVQEATGCEPIPYAGGGSPERATSSRFMHNAWRNVKAKVDGRRGDVLYATEENIVSDCATSGRFAIYDLKGSKNGEGWRNIEKTKFRMKVLDTWWPEGQKGTTGCDSAHYLSDRGDGLLAYSFYSQGTRFLDVSNPRKIRQVGYFRPDDANVWAPYFHDGYVYVADFTRGIDVLKFKGGPRSKALRAPVDLTPSTLQPSQTFGYICPVKPDAVR
jgi:hypothetical protein